MKIVSWNTNSRSNKETLKEQCKFLDSGNFDVITLQEITENSQSFFKDYYKDLYVAKSKVYLLRLFANAQSLC